MARRGRVPEEVYAEQLADCEQHLIRVRIPGKVITMLTAKYGVDRKTVKNWMKKVRERWAAEANAADLPSQRGEMDRTLNELMGMAMTATAVIREKDGSLCKYPPGHPQAGMPILRPDPNFDAALKATGQLRALWGMDRPQRASMTIRNGDTGTSTTIEAGPSADDRKALEAGLKGLRPRVIDIDDTKAG
jgi:hypothetical protein